MHMSRSLPRLSRFACRSVVLAIAMTTATALRAETVTLRSIDGDFVLSGKIATLQDGAYVLSGPLGDLRVTADRVTCEGQACPDTQLDLAAATVPDTVKTAAPLPPPLTEASATTTPEPQPVDPVVAPDLATALLHGFAEAKGSAMPTEGVDGIGHRLVADGGEIVLATGPGALEALTAGTADVALITAVPPTSEPAGSYRIDLLAHDAVAVVTHPSNPVRQLMLDEIRAIYAGEITNWSQVGGTDSPIRLIAADDDQISLDSIEQVLFADGDARRAAQIEEFSGKALDQAIAKDPLAIGFARYGGIESSQAVEIVDQCGLRALPEPVMLKSGTYPLQLPVMLVTRTDEADPLVGAFAEYATSEKSDPILAATGLVDRTIQRVALDDRASSLALPASGTGRTARLAKELRDDAARHERLTLAFHFDFSSAAMDPAAEADIARLIDVLSSLPAGSKVQIVGFSDDVGTAQTNRVVSVERARTVAASVQAEAADRLKDVTIDVVGFGDLMPIACNDDEAGRALNRRVEVWIDVSGTGEAVGQPRLSDAEG
jgi:phosphate transport system substrate-binding protein